MSDELRLAQANAAEERAHRRGVLARLQSLRGEYRQVLKDRDRAVVLLKRVLDTYSREGMGPASSHRIAAHADARAFIAELEQSPKPAPQPLPACVGNAHCVSRREHGDGECGCWHDSLGMLLKGDVPK
jgi:hypothetical protein